MLEVQKKLSLLLISKPKTYEILLAIIRLPCSKALQMLELLKILLISTQSCHTQQGELGVKDNRLQIAKGSNRQQHQMLTLR